MAELISITLVLVGIINLLPVIGLLSNHRLTKLYQLEFSEPNLEILMRHRALMFGVIGGYVLVAAFIPHHQTMAVIMAFLSMAGFIGIAQQVGRYNAAIRKVILVDVIGLIILAIAAMLLLTQGMLIA